MPIFSCSITDASAIHRDAVDDTLSADASADKVQTMTSQDGRKEVDYTA